MRLPDRPVIAFFLGLGIVGRMSSETESWWDFGWKWFSRLADVVQVLGGTGILLGAFSVVAGWLNAPWKVIIPLCVVGAAFIVPFMVRLVFRPRPQSQDEIREIYRLKEHRLNRVISMLSQLAEDRALGVCFHGVSGRQLALRRYSSAL